jgi:hypothetical protein
MPYPGIDHRTPLYRDPADGWRARYASLLAARLGEMAVLPAELRSIHARRTARVAAGVFGFVGSTVVFAMALAQVARHGLFEMESTGSAGALLTSLFLAVVAGTGLVYAAAWLCSWQRFARTVLHALLPSGDLFADLEVLSRVSAASAARELTTRLERPSVMWPLLAVVMNAPLMLHWLAAGVADRALPEPHSFGLWIALSALLVGHCHVYLAYRAWNFAADLSQTPNNELFRHDSEGWVALWGAVGWSLITGLLLFGVPTLLVAATGVLFVPLAFAQAARRVHRERVILAGVRR